MVTSTGAFANARAAVSPPNPAPIIATRGLLIESSLPPFVLPFIHGNQQRVAGHPGLSAVQSAGSSHSERIGAEVRKVLARLSREGRYSGDARRRSENRSLISVARSHPHRSSRGVGRHADGHAHGAGTQAALS